MAVTRGYKQSAEHVAKRIKRGAEHPNWKGSAIAAKSGRSRAERLYPVVGPCTQCGAAKAERHHRDEDTANNAPTNIAVLCRRCHMAADGRLEALRTIGRRPRGLGQNAVLTLESVRELRLARAAGATFAALAQRFGISAQQAWRIVNGKSWRSA